MTQLEKTACFTGHRKIPFSRRHRIKKILDEVLEANIEQGVIYYGAGGALGFDTMAAQAVLRARKKHPEVKLILVLPCRTQADRWPARDQAIYEDIKKQADKVVYISDEYTKDCMKKRNQHLVEHSDRCIYYLTQTHGGTAYTVGYAQFLCRKLISITSMGG